MQKSTFNLVGLALLLTGITLAGCKQTMHISKVNYSQPVETVLKPEKDGMVTDIQHGFQFNMLPLQYAETRDTSTVMDKEVRMIRGKEGFYYITAPGFKHVYVMSPEKGKLKLEKKIKIGDEGIGSPAFNQRNPHVILLNRSTGDTYAITAKGIEEGSKEKSHGG